MFSLCDNMKWNHLPNAGGLNDQDPRLLDKFRIIFAARNKHQADEMKKQERESKRHTSKGSRPARRR